MPLQKALAVTVLILVVGAFLQFVTVLTGDRPPVLLLLLGLIYFGCFYQQANGKGGTAIFLVLVIAVMVPLLTILNEDLGDTILYDPGSGCGDRNAFDVGGPYFLFQIQVAPLQAATRRLIRVRHATLQPTPPYC